MDVRGIRSEWRRRGRKKASTLETAKPPTPAPPIAMASMAACRLANGAK